MQIINFLRTEFKCCNKEELPKLVRDYHPKSEINYILVTDNEEISEVYKMVDLLFLQAKSETFYKDEGALAEIALKFKCLENTTDTNSILNQHEDILIMLDRNKAVVGTIDNLPVKKIMISNFTKENKARIPRAYSHQAASKYYQKMVENLDEEIFVADGDGTVIFLNPASEKMLQLPMNQIIGRNVKDLEAEGFLKPSCTLETIKAGKKIDLIQEVKNGRKLLATGVPIFDANGKITMVISTSKDLDYLNGLLEQIENQNITLEIQKEEIKTLRDQILNKEGFVSRSKAMDEVKKKITRIAPLDMIVLVDGETGVGKEVAVKAIHRFSNRKDKPFIKINCGMIPENLMESEFFGYEDGAFTGASKSGKIGTVELANGGTLFLDEIGEMPLSLQVKLLEFLQDKTITRVGGTKKIEVDARIIAATNRDLEDMCKKGLFRQDLYYRLNVFQIHIPSLREREDDILAIAEYYLSQYNTKYGLTKRFSQDSKNAFLSYNWPGNIREMEHVLECLYVTVDASSIEATDFKRLVSNKENKNYASKIYCTEIMPLKEAKWEVEKQLIRKAYQVVGSTYKVAEMLSVDQSTVVKLMKKHRVTK